MKNSRSAAIVSVIAFLLLAAPAVARDVTDSAGRTVAIPDAINRVFAAGPPASTLLYVLAPQDMIGWVRAPRDDEKRFLLPASRELPELGRLTGRGDTLNLERLIAEKPDNVPCCVRQTVCQNRGNGADRLFAALEDSFSRRRASVI